MKNLLKSLFGVLVLTLLLNVNAQSQTLNTNKQVATARQAVKDCIAGEGQIIVETTSFTCNLLSAPGETVIVTFFKPVTCPKDAQCLISRILIARVEVDCLGRVVSSECFN